MENVKCEIKFEMRIVKEGPTTPLMCEQKASTYIE